MSGIVRGWTDASEMRDLTAGSHALVFARDTHPALNDDAFPVAVVPLDDATMAGMAYTLVDVFHKNAVGAVEAEEAMARALRAALGLEGGA